ncbi:MAG: hypothetical protein JWM56_354 [Candidatus Peribacteria bacterium]|nr:hypothetical protein [Candidatus Peribacteria bacterium]
MNQSLASSTLSPNRLHQFFRIGIALKGINGFLELLSGLALIALQPAQLSWIAYYLTMGELYEDPNDFFAHIILKTIAGFTPHARFVAVVFLLSHGIIKLFLVWEIFRNKLWAYPLTIAVLLLFMVYQVLEIIHGHSLLLTALTVFDAFIVVLTWQEYQMKKAHFHTPSTTVSS